MRALVCGFASGDIRNGTARWSGRDPVPAVIAFAADHVRPLAARPWRAVEAQHQVSTRKLVDSLDDQALLETMLEESKPPAPAETVSLHYLLATPFRYPPLRHGSRFGGRDERGIWYGAETQATAFAEAAYYRLLFLAGSAADLGTLELPLSVYRVAVATERGVDLASARFSAVRERIVSPLAYAHTQTLGSAMRAASVQAFRYPSARDPDGGVCVGLFDPAAFAARRPSATQTWHCFATREQVEFLRHDHVRDSQHRFARADFLVDGVLPAPAP